MTDPFQPLTVRDIPRLTRYFSARGTRLCRPCERVLDLLPPATHGFIKEDGERVLDEAGQRIGR